MSNPARRKWSDLLDRLEKEGSDERSHLERERAWAELGGLLRAYAIRYARDLLGPSRDVEDLVQQVLLKLQEKRTRHLVRTSNSPRGYVMRIVRNTAYDILRDRESEFSGWSYMMSVPAPGEGSVEPSEWIERARTLIAELSPAERRMLLWRFREGISIDQVADRLDISYSAAAKRLFRLVHRLRASLDES